MRTNYVLIDYENVQPAALAELEKEHFKILVFVGANQTKVNYEVADTLQRLGPKATYVKISGNGSNALDFHIAYYIGQLAAADKNGFFHIISKDSGFDPLIAHLKTQKIYACRSRGVGDMPIVKAANSKSPSEKLEFVVANLRQRGPSRPRTVKTLTSTISSLFQKALAEDEVSTLLEELQRKGYVTVNAARVSYSLPE